MKIHLLLLFVLTLMPACQPQMSGLVEETFVIQPIDRELREAMVSKNVFGPHSPVPAERLRLVKIRHYGFDNQVHDGQLIVLDACSEQVKAIFQELLNQKFAIERVELITRYGGNDSLSMAANNTSAHNLRPVTGGNGFSLHAYGTAIDLNPVQNPYIGISCEDRTGTAVFQPAAGIGYANRKENRPGKLNRRGMAEDVVEVFAKNGFYTWGGHWDCPIDYQHFQISRSLTELLVIMPPGQARSFFLKAVDYYNDHVQPIEDPLARGSNGTLAEAYAEDPDAFMRRVNYLD